MAVVRPLLRENTRRLRRPPSVRTKSIALFGIFVALLLSLSATEAFAQRHRGGRRVAFRFGQWYPYPYPVVGFPGPGFLRNQFASVRLQVTPRDGIVYVDGYAAGMVDDFDGVFQRLQLIPGHHEIVVYLRGYRTLRQNLYLTPGSSHTIKQTLMPLAPGDSDEPQPVPLVPPNQTPGAVLQPGLPPQQQAARFGMLSLRVQPMDANILIDGESWRGPQSQERLTVQLSEGTHHVRIERVGFQTFAVDVDVRAGETTSLNVSLTN
jgi:hypothetical protein